MSKPSCFMYSISCLRARYEEATRELLRFMNMDLSDIKGLISLEVGGANGMINVGLVV